MKNLIVIKNAFKLPCKCCGQIMSGKLDNGTITFENALARDVIATDVREAVEEALMPDFDELKRVHEAQYREMKVNVVRDKNSSEQQIGLPDKATSSKIEQLVLIDDAIEEDSSCDKALDH